MRSVSFQFGVVLCMLAACVLGVVVWLTAAPATANPNCTSGCSSTPSNVCTGSPTGSCPYCTDGSPPLVCSGSGVTFTGAAVFSTNVGTTTTSTNPIPCQTWYNCVNGNNAQQGGCLGFMGCNGTQFWTYCVSCGWDSGTVHNYNSCVNTGCVGD